MQPTLFPDVARPAVRTFVRLVWVGSLPRQHALIEKWHDLICKKVHAYKWPSEEDKNDAMAHAMLSALKSFQTYDPSKGFTVQTHIGSAVEKQLITFYRKTKARGIHGDDAHKASHSQIDETFTYRPPEQKRDVTELKKKIEAAMVGLSQVEKAVILLRNVEGMSGREVAGLLGETIDEVDRIEARAKEKLRGWLEE